MMLRTDEKKGEKDERVIEYASETAEDLGDHWEREHASTVGFWSREKQGGWERRKETFKYEEEMKEGRR